MKCLMSRTRRKRRTRGRPISSRRKDCMPPPRLSTPQRDTSGRNNSHHASSHSSTHASHPYSPRSSLLHSSARCLPPRAGAELRPPPSPKRGECAPPPAMSERRNVERGWNGTWHVRKKNNGDDGTRCSFSARKARFREEVEKRLENQCFTSPS